MLRFRSIVLVFCLTFALAVALQPASAALPSGLVAHYTFDNNDAADSSGNGNNGTLAGGPSFAAGPAGFGNALVVDLGKHVVLPSTSTLGLYNQDFTVTAWVNATSFNGLGGYGGDWSVLGNQLPNPVQGSAGLHLVLRGGQPYMGFFGNDIGSGSNLALNTWYHIAWRYTKSTGEMAMFLGGNQISSGGGHGAFLGTGSTFIGRCCESWDAPRYAKGRIDDVQIYNRPLTQQEIASLTAPPQPATGSIGGVKFNDLNFNGGKSVDEPGLSGWTVYADLNNNGLLDSGEPSATTDASGNYTIGGLVAGTYVLREVPQPGWVQTAPAAGFHSVALGPGANLAGRNFGNTQPRGRISIGPASDVNEVGNPHIFTVTVRAFPGAAPVSFSNIVPSVSPLPSSQSDTCAAPLLSGTNNTIATCTVTINSATIGTFTANVRGTITFNGPLGPFALNLDTDPATSTPNGSGGEVGGGPAMKAYVSPPSADAGGPYSANEGSSITLSGTGSDPDGGSVFFAWDLDNNGSFETSGQNPSFTAPDGPAVVTVVLRVTDDEGQTATASATVTVNNVAPTSSLSNTGPVTEGSPVSVSFGPISDPSALDVAAGLRVALDCAGGSLASATYANSAGNLLSSICWFNTAGSYTVAGKVMDKDGGATVSSATVVVNLPPTPTFSLTPSGVPGCICTPLFMNTQPEGAEHLFFKASGSSATLSVFAHAVNSTDPETVEARVYDTVTNAQAGSTMTVSYPAGTAAGTEISASQSLTGLTAGRVYRIKVTTPNTPPTQPHWRAEINGASEAAITSPSFASIEPDAPVNWYFNVASGEALDVRVFGQGTPSPLSGSQSLTLQWADPAGNPVGPPTTLSGPYPIDQTVSAPGAASTPGVWRLMLLLADSHYRLERTGAAADSGIYLVNRVPVANAGPDMTVGENTLVTLLGSGFDPDNDPLSYAWVQVGGTPVTLTGANTAAPSFVAPNVPAELGSLILTFQLTVRDACFGVSTDTVVVTVNDVRPAKAQGARTIGYWKNHETHLLQMLTQDGPINLGDTTVSTVAQAVSVLSNASASDARNALRAQLLATVLNLRNGSNVLAIGPDIRSTVQQAVIFLAGHPAPVKSNHPDRAAAIALKDTLDTYNNSGE